MNFKNYFFTLTFTFFIAVSQAFAGDFYWVGNSGNWNDASHWASVSGGKGGVGVPTFSDNVTIDDKSFLQRNVIININSSISLNNLNIISQKDFTINSGRNIDINIYGSVQVTSNFNNQIKSTLHFKSTKNETVHLGWFVWQTDIYFDGTGTYKLTSPIQNHNNELHHISGILDLNQHDVLCGSFISNSNAKRTLISEKSTILAYHQFAVEDKKNDYDFSNTTIYFMGQAQQITAENKNIYELIFLNSTTSSTQKTINNGVVSNDTVSCGNNCDGELIVTATTTCPNATVDWLPGSPFGDCPLCPIPGPNISDTIFNLCPGIYTAVIRNDCDGSVKAPQGTVDGHPSIVVIDSIITQTSCKDTCDGSINVTVTGPSYAIWSFQWMPIPADLPSISSSQPENTMYSNRCAGAYSLEVSDGFGCIDTFDFVVPEPDYIYPNVSVTNILCFGDCNGTATANPNGGNGGYTYQWSANAFPPNPLTNPGIANLCIGSYTVDVLDSKGCPGDTTITISAPDSLTITSSQINVSCGGYCDASASATVVSGGVGPYTHIWSTGFSQPRNAGQISTIINLCAGTYTDSIVDANGCDTVLTFIITEPDTLLTTTAFTNVTCFGACDGTAITSPYNGTAPYSYVWTPTPSSFDSVAGLCPGQVIVVVTDTMGCEIRDTITITEPNILLAIPSVVQNMSCPGVCDGIATSNPTGGTLPYSWSWNTVPTQSTQTTTNTLCQGFVTVTVTDSNSCVAVDSVFIDEPIPMVLTMYFTDATCDGICNGTGGVDVTGGIPGYSYDWLPVPPNGQGTDTIWGLCAPNTYTVTVKDNNGAGCSASNSITINEPTPVTATITTVNLRCNSLCEGSATITPAGGTPPYSVSWDGAPGVPVIGASNTILNLCALPNPHTADVSDANGCITPFTFVINEPPALTTTSTSTNLTCSNQCIGTGTTTPAGGTPPYSYSWNDPLSQDSLYADSLCAGTWVVIVTDDSLCTVMDSVTIIEPDTLDANVTFTNITCNNANNGTAVSLPFGGTPGYIVVWRTYPGDVIVPPGGGSIGPLSAGQYYVTVTDNAGCIDRDTITITNPPSIQVNPSAINTSCQTNCDGQATVNPTGGTGSLVSWSFSWCSGENTQTTNPTLCPGTYCVTVTDSMSCSRTDSVTIAPTIIIDILTDTIGISCNGFCDGTATANPSGGILPYSYLWNTTPPQFTPTADSLCPGTYIVTVTDFGGCVATQSVVMPIDPDVLVPNGAFTNVTCKGANNGTISANPSGGVPPYTINYSVTPQTGLGPGTYWVTVTDDNTCSQTDTLIITEPDTISPNATVTHVNCNGNSTGSICLAPSGGTPGYTYLWSAGLGTNACVNGLIAGSYSVTITDTNGCTKSITYQITQPTVFASNALNIPPTCAGSCNGTAGIIVSGGTPPHTTSWSFGPPFTTDTITNLCAGTYIATSIDFNGCSTSQNIVLTSPQPLLTNVTGTSIACNGACTGTATVAPSGGTGPYSIIWTSSLGLPITNPTNPSIANLCPDTYTATITDSKGCVTTGSYTVINPLVLAVTLDSTNVTCNGANNGTALATPTGGTPPYTYSWTGGNLPNPTNTAAISNLIPGIYSVNVTDSNGCFFSGSVNITQPLVISPNAVIVGADCGVNNGSITLFPSGGTLNYNHSWSNGSTTNAVINVLAGFYTDTITDGNGCVQLFTFAVNNPTGPTGVTVTVVDASCFGGCNGSANVIPIGGTPGYSYVWNGVAGDSTITGQCAGTLNLTVTDALGCLFNTSVVIDETDSISVNSTSTGVLCSGTCNGTASVTPSGGTAPYTYLWTGGSADGQTTPSVSGLCVGPTSVAITDFKGCTKVVNFNITSPNILTVSTTFTDVKCNGGSDGTATAIPLDGTAPYTYLWNDNLSQTTQTAINLAAGTYTVTVTDFNGCSSVDVVTINEPSLMLANEVTTPAACTFNDGTATVSPTGGAGGYTYVWTAFPGVIDSNVTGLGAGTYTVQITDANSCMQSFLIPISNPSGPTLSVTPTNTSCNGTCDGAATVAVVSGTPNYTFLWTGGSITGQTTTTVSGLCAGNYTVQGTDGNGCKTVKLVIIGQNLVLAGTATSIPVTCNGLSNGSAIVVPNGGVPPYTYSWSGPCPAPPNNAVAGLCAGNYTVTVTDSNGCSGPVAVVINEPTVLTVSASANNLTCFGQNDGSATATPGGGTPPYTYLWSDGVTSTPTITGLVAGNHSVTVTDANGCSATANLTIFSGNAMTANFNATPAACGVCDGSATINVGVGAGPYTYFWLPGGQNTPTVNNLCPGAYSVRVTNIFGCTQTFNVLISNPNGPTITTGSDSTSCYNSCDGSTWVDVIAGNPPYTFQWNDTLLQTNDTTTNTLCAGLYNVIVQDSLGCITVDSIRVYQPAQITANITTTPISCNGICDGTATANPSGGVAPYTFNWSTGGSGIIETGLCAGNHSVTITDANGCSIVKNFFLSNPSIIVNTLSSTSTTCNGDCDGTALTTTSGGTPPYIYSWSPTGPPTQTNSLATSLCAGLYTVTVTDNRGCVQADTISVITPDSLFTTSNPTDVICNGENSGSIFTNPTGGVSPYSYIWNPTSPIQTTQTATNLFAGTYNVIVVDANNCTAYDTVIVTEPDVLLDSTTVNGPTCGLCDGSATANPVGGSGSYAYLWGNGNTTQTTTTGLCAGIITLQITDLGTGCVYNFNVIVNSVTGPTIVLTLTGESCPGSCDGTALASASNGNPPYSFSWTPPGTPSTLGDSLATNLCSDFYTVMVTDSIGCISTDTFSITSTGLNLSIINVIPESCFSACDGSATVVAGAGLVPFTYQWNPSGGNNDVAVNLCVGNYVAVVTDSLNCRDSIGTTITGPTILTVSIGINTPISCNGVCDGALIASPLGGTLPYTYLWSDGQTTQLATNLCAGTYWIEVTDGNGCTTYDTLVLDEPTPILANETLFNPTCNVCDGVIQLIPSGGTGPYQFTWAAPLIPQNTSTVINLCADIYSVDITDDNNCTQTFTFVLDNIGAPNPNVTNTPVTCNGLCNASLVSNPTGGAGPYTYVWSPNANPPNIILFDSAITNLCPDIYDVRVTDSLGCVGISIDTITQPAVLLANITSSNVTCFGINDGWAVAHPSGGTLPYNIANWIPGGVNDSIFNLAPNTYVVNIIDANGCSVTDSVIITEPALITATSSIIDASCTSACDGQATLTVSGGTGTYTYSWNPSLQITNPATNLCVGSYIVTIKDQNNCSVPVTVNIGSLDTVIAMAGNDVTVCAGSTVNLSGTAIGAVNSTQWFELPGMNVISNTNNVSVTSTMSGTICYVFKVIGPCNGFDTVCVTYNSQPIANAGIDVTILEGTTTQLNATGGGTYVWTPSVGLSDTSISNPIANPMVTTTYFVSVTSDEGCTSTDSVTVTIIPTIHFPDGITPNGDGKNDTWVIDYIDEYPNHVVEIYNRWGELLYRSTDYKNDWNGTYNGENLPVGTYYYVIELNDDKTKPFTGPITVLR